MSVSAPYCTSSDVYLMRIYAHDPGSTDYTEEGTPRKTVVEYWITQMASQIDMAYASAGYEIPFTARSGEDWPTFQTTFLKYFNAVGVASMTGADASSPPIVQIIQGRRVERSFFEVEWSRMIGGTQGIARNERDNTVLLRAAARVGTPADYMLGDVSPPLMDHLEGYDDPTKYDLLRDFTRRNQNYFNAMNLNNQPTSINAGSLDYLYLLHKRMGYTYYAD